MTYPVLVMCVAFLIVTGLVVFIIPKFIEIFQDFNVQMPAPTQFLITISNNSRTPVGNRAARPMAQWRWSARAMCPSMKAGRRRAEWIARR